MSHLTTNQILQVVDGTIANGVRTELLSHLEACPRCRREVDFQRKLERVARSAPLVRPSQNFTRDVIALVVPRSKKSWSTKLIDNLSSVLAMGFVLTIVWYAANIPVTPSATTQPSVFSEVIKTYVDYYSSAREFVTKNQPRISAQPAKEHSSNPEEVVLLTVVSVLILVGIDRFVVRRVIKLHT
jgi:hypothetical protein